MSRHIIIGQSPTDRRNLKLDVDLLLTSRLLLQANSGGGKSWLLRRLAEQFYGHVQTIIIDPEGEFYTLREKYGYVLVGEGGETPCDVRSAAMLAERFLELKASAVCDLYEAFRSRPMDRRQWVRSFINALLDAPRSMWHPLIVIVDEAHKFCPQETPKAGNQSDREIIGGCKDAMIALSTTGRKRGFCPIWATQRLAKVDKDASAEMFNRMVGMTIEDVDVDRAADLMSVSREDKQEFRQSLRTLSPGEFYAFGRAITNERKLVMVGEVFTHHPSTGMAAKYETAPPMPDEVRKFLPQLADLPKEAEEKIKTVAALQTEIRELRKQLKAVPTSIAKVVPPKIVEKRVEVRVEVVPKEVKKEFDRLREKLRLVDGHVELLTQAIGKAPETATKITIPDRPLMNVPARTPIKVVSVVESNGNGSGKLRAGAERMLAALVQWSPEGMLIGQMRSHAGMKKSGTFNTYLSDLRKGDYIAERDGKLFATQPGIGYFGGNVPSAPQSTEEVLSVWEPKLREGARRMLRILVDAGGEPMTKDDLSAKSNMAVSGTFNTYLSDLRTARLIETGRDGVSANRETLFL